MDHIPWEFRSKKGTRTGKGNLNQDVCLQFSNTNISCFAVLDGHGRDGFQVAHFVADLLKEKLVERTKYTAFVLSDLAPLFKEIDLELCERGLKGGTTIACILFQHQTKTIVANAGDSHIVLIRNGKAHRLTATHNTTNDQERVRIESNGGEIRNNRVSGSHQVTRGFGDHHLKSYIISEPCVIEVDIGDLDRYLILGSDGFWDGLKDQEAVDILQKYSQFCLPAQLIPLFEKAKTASNDDISCIIVDLTNFVSDKGTIDSKTQ